MAVKNKSTVKIEQFPGVNNRDDSSEVKLSAFIAGSNCDVTRQGKVRRRPGCSQVYNGAVDAVWFEPLGLRQPVFQAAGVLYELDENYAARQIKTGLSTVRAGDLVGAFVAGRLFLSNGREALVVDASGSARTWGLPRIDSQPRLTATSGNLRAGRYQIAVTYQRADGQEGGTGLATGIEIPEDGGFTLADIPTHSEADFRNIYLTGANGKELRRIYQLGATETSWTYRGDGHRFGVPLQTQFKGPPPTGHIVTYNLGRLFVADGPYLYESDPYHLELFNPRKYTAFERDIQVVAPVQDGLFVATSAKTVFLAGADAASFVAKDLADYGGFRGTLGRIEADHIGEGKRQGEAALWLSERGFCAGFNGGAFANLTDRYFELPASFDGTAAIREYAGQIHYLAVTGAYQTITFRNALPDLQVSATITH